MSTHHNPSVRSPRGWRALLFGEPAEIADESTMRTVSAEGPDFPRPSNEVTTTKYTPWNFLPKNLFEQFHRWANLYFLLVIILNFALDVFGREVSMLPLLFVLACTAIKDFYEDFSRRKADREVNLRLCTVVGPEEGQHRLVSWKDLRVGQLVQLHCDEVVPADLLVVFSSDPLGTCFVETSNMDGETTLKSRQCVLPAIPQRDGIPLRQLSSTQAQAQEAPQLPGGILSPASPDEDGSPKFDGIVPPTQLALPHFTLTYTPPHRDLTVFQGNLTLPVDEPREVGIGSTLWRGCVLRTTEWVVGIVVFTGPETKMVMNTEMKTPKRSKLERSTNYAIFVLAACLLVMCLAAGIGVAVWDRKHRNFPLQGKYDPAGRGVTAFWMAIVVFQVIIPVALYIMLEAVKLVVCKLMECDLAMYDPESDVGMRARALNIPEDLGQVEHIFSDKTGTLTDNVMVFQKCFSLATGGVVYAGDKQFLLSERSPRPDQTAPGLFVLCMAACNTVVATLPVDRSATDEVDPPRRVYHAESPDELALVRAASSFGITFLNRSRDEVELLGLHGEVLRYRVFTRLEFDSTRKLMSVILEPIVGNPLDTEFALRPPQLLLLCKGADSSVAQRLSAESLCFERQLEQATIDFSQEGLRTLWLSYRLVERAELDTYLAAYQDARRINGPKEKDEALQAAFSKIERNLIPLGVSAIEDKLQDGVPETIELLQRAGLKIWVLTGDRQDTAINVALRCRLLSQHMVHITLNAENEEACVSLLQDAVARTSRDIRESEVPFGIVIDGKTLRFALHTRAQDDFHTLTNRSSAVLCCRVSPVQKAEVVSFVRHRTRRQTLAVGDGANDVSMLQRADVGIGISGREGLQAVMASDFSIARFRFLAPLLLVHGHWAYHRLAYLVVYLLYKNAFFALLLFIFYPFSGYSATRTIDDWNLIFYSVLYTSLPPLLAGVLEQPLTRQQLLALPALYSRGRNDEVFNPAVFVSYVLELIWQTVVLYFIPYLVYYNRDDAALYTIGVLHLFGSVVVVNMELLLDVHFHTLPLAISIAISLGATVFLTWLIYLDPRQPWSGSLTSRWGSVFWLCLLLSCTVALLPHFIYLSLRAAYRPTTLQTARKSGITLAPAPAQLVQRHDAPSDAMAPSRAPSSHEAVLTAETVTESC
eukprot:TRINITY_DN94304_c0_g1_i1.p1 TRINITY_DN94304_c0_g1~~TRINITY_DN94304_c0_g1_i1.p1  ORF type:complete len:1174 (-),score=153.17 TRINITY_DN94304_c0_g1_i1:101-3580(-)